jgi:prenyltransferase beta subunit
MIIFGQRKKIAAQFEKWCAEHGVQCCALSMIGFLQGLDLLNEEKVYEYLKTIDISNEEANGLKNFVKED